ncbi:MAG TPA: hypothetical protein VFQ16_04575 [Burkholderiaceae bacterium]|nr:hypothetical protein [Burkholderiaceae bacterium]
MFNITAAAAAEIRAAAHRSQADGMALRVAARALDDGSIDYGLGFDEEREHDETAEAHGLTLLLGRSSRPYLANTTLDYVELEPGQFGFVFVPGAEESAAAASGCGSGGCGSCGTTPGACA